MQEKIRFSASLRLRSIPAVLAIAFVSACGAPVGPGGDEPTKPPAAEIRGLYLNVPGIAVGVGDRSTVKAYTVPFLQDGALVSWTVDDPSIASVDGGVVTGLAPGRAKLTAKSGSFSATCNVFVRRSVRVEKIELEPEVGIVQGSRRGLAMRTFPRDAMDPGFAWSSDDEKVAKVSGGIVEAVGAGKTWVRIAGAGLEASCRIEVTAPPLASIDLNAGRLRLAPGGSARLRCFPRPAYADPGVLTWKSSDASVATVEDGTVRALSTGTATITAESGALSSACEVAVAADAAASTIHFWSQFFYAYTGDSPSRVLIFNRDGEGMYEGALEWRSSNEAVATVSAAGEVEALSRGGAVIWATAVDGGSSADIACIVQYGNDFAAPWASRMAVGSENTLAAWTRPRPGRSFSSFSSNSDVIEVGSDGRARAKAAGFATIAIDSGGADYTWRNVEVTDGIAKVIELTSFPKEPIRGVVDLEWAPGQYFESVFEVESARTAAGPYSKIKETTDHYCMIEGLEIGAEYWFRVRTRVGSAYGPFSDPHRLRIGDRDEGEIHVVVE